VGHCHSLSSVAVHLDETMSPAGEAVAKRR
jgi:hypothetical protein